jgi:2-dehydro-3-deoxygalactonokinase
MTGGALIGIDWGTTSFRACLMDARGNLLDQRLARAGILEVENSAFEEVLEREVGAWLAAAPDLPIVASGMIGSRQGWVEVPYLRCPTDARAIAAALSPHVTTRGRRLRFVPGLTVPGDLPDVMRGEETEILGALRDHPAATLFLLPGTHSKWARVAEGRIEGFATFMTGELFAILKGHSILGRLMAGTTFADLAFARGARVGLDPDPAKGGLLHRIFSARTLGLVGDLAPDDIESYLSGLLIGIEVREALAFGSSPDRRRQVVLVGGTELVARYDRVLSSAGVQAIRAAPSAAARGQFHLAQLAGVLD